MAYASLVSLSQTAYQILNHHQYKCSIFIDKKRQIATIHDCAVYFQTVLEDFPEKSSSFEEQIRDVANEAEYVIECLMLPHILEHRRYESGMVIELSKKIDELEAVTEKIESIRNSLKIKEDKKLCDSLAASSSSSGLLPTSNDAMIGFHEDLMEIKKQLCGESSQFQLISIVGMGGIGKSTLARNAYNDRLIIETFDIRAWVNVSRDYSEQNIISQMLISLKNLCTGRGNGREKVYKSLKGRRYLIVMDDMWSTQAWDAVRNMFPDDNNGSRIILTTRLLDVAAYPVSCSLIHKMQFMDEDESWNLLRQKIFGHQSCPLELENIGKEIARNCRGLPLAIVVIAGVVSTASKNPASWREIAENVNSVVAAKVGQYEGILSLSYTHLPYHLRPCFLYMGVFPEDHEIRISRLIKLWVAEGFLKRGSKSPEAEAEECLEDLVKRSLVLVTKETPNGKIKSCSLHDLMRDLCIKKAHEEKFLVNFMCKRYDQELPCLEGYNLHHQRRITISTINRALYRKIEASTIRSIMCFHDCPSLKKFRLLRVLDVLNSGVGSLPAQLFELFHLRFLGITYTGEVIPFPADVANLKNLQTLIIRGAFSFLSQQIWTLPQLRHLIVANGLILGPEATTSTLENLQTLSQVLLSMCTDEFLKMIPNLKKIKIYCVRITCLNNLVYLQQLENLSLCSRFISSTWRKGDFTLPRMLKKLTLFGPRIPWSDMTIVGTLPNLQVLKLRECHGPMGSTWKTTEGEFPKLEFLLIEESDHLEHWMTESSHFPRLKFLLLHYCLCLSEIPEGIGEISTLELIEVKHCTKSLEDSAKRTQEEQESLGNDALQVRCLHY